MLSLVEYLPLIGAAIAGCLLGVLITLPISYSTGMADGRKLERAASLQRSIDLIDDRSKVNAEINALGRDGLCRELGGVWLPDEASCE